MIGNLPKEYNKAVHGPYDPAVFYGKKDLKLSQVKIYELPLWLMRRQFYNPIAYGRCMSRNFWRWNHKFVLAKNCGVTPFFQVVVGASAFFYLINYEGIAAHKNAKYHW